MEYPLPSAKASNNGQVRNDFNPVPLYTAANYSNNGKVVEDCYIRIGLFCNLYMADYIKALVTTMKSTQVPVEKPPTDGLSAWSSVHGGKLHHSTLLLFTTPQRIST